ncbi:hypothetical protein R3P38DRAFT_2488405, partial [Favolaschia claudopus]
MEHPKNLPVTTHFLKHEQRVRLIRSTRKVGHLLGETPLFIDSSSPIAGTFTGPKARTRNAQIYIAAPSRSSSLRAQTGDSSSEPSHASTSVRPLLGVHVPPPNRDSDPPVCAPSPASMVFPTTPAEEQHRQRTRKMARIVRTLGENVPTELVFPANAQQRHIRRTSTLNSRRRRSSKLVRSSSAASRARRDSLTRGASSLAGSPSDQAGLEALAEAESDAESASVYSTLSGVEYPKTP